MKKQANIRSLLTTVAVLFTTQEALAQGVTPVSFDSAQNESADSRTDTGIDDIVVRARRREELLRTVPVSISAFSTKALEQKQIVTTQDLTFVTPGLSVAPALSRDTPAFVIRGMQRLTSGEGAPAVLTYFADVPMPNDGSLLPTFDVASMQVLKGPQGTLFGRNTTGGAVLLYPNAPTYEFGGYVRATYGEYDERTLEGAINLPIIADKIALRVAGQIARRDGYTKNLGIGGDMDDRHTDSIRASLLLEPTHNLKNTTIFDYYRAREVGTGIILYGAYQLGGAANGGIARGFPFNNFFDCGRAASCDIDLLVAQQQANGPRTSRPSVAPRSDRDIWGIANTTTLDLGNVTFKNVFGYRKVTINYARDFDGSPLRINEHVGRTAPVQISNEFQILGKAFDDRLDWITGAFYLDSRDHGRAGALVANFSPIVPPAYNEKYNIIKSKALFGQISYKLDMIANGLKFNAGFRYTWDDNWVCSIASTLAAGPVGNRENCIASNSNISSVKSSAPTWTVGLDYQVTDELFFYAASRRGYRSGGINQSGLAPILAAYESYKPEKVTDIEVGAKGVWRAGSVNGAFNLSAYRSKYQDIQVTTIVPPNFDGDGNPSNDPFGMVVNAAKATIQGIEFDTSISPMAGLTFNGFVNYTDAKYDKFEIAPILQPLITFTPETTKFPYTPKWTVGGGLTYAADLPDNLGSLSFNINHFRSAKILFSSRVNDPLAVQKAYSNTSARLFWDEIAGSRVGVRVFARNLFNTLYAPAAGFAVPAFTSNSRIFNEPRVIGAELRVSFGSK